MAQRRQRTEGNMPAERGGTARPSNDSSDIVIADKAARVDCQDQLNVNIRVKNGDMTAVEPLYQNSLRRSASENLENKSLDVNFDTTPVTPFLHQEPESEEVPAGGPQTQAETVAPENMPTSSAAGQVPTVDPADVFSKPLSKLFGASYFPANIKDKPQTEESQMLGLADVVKKASTSSSSTDQVKNESQAPDSDKGFEKLLDAFTYQNAEDSAAGSKLQDDDTHKFDHDQLGQIDEIIEGHVQGEIDQHDARDRHEQDQFNDIAITQIHDKKGQKKDSEQQPSVVHGSRDSAPNFEPELSEEEEGEGRGGEVESRDRDDVVPKVNDLGSSSGAVLLNFMDQSIQFDDQGFDPPHRKHSPSRHWPQALPQTGHQVNPGHYRAIPRVSQQFGQSFESQGYPPVPANGCENRMRLEQTQQRVHALRAVLQQAQQPTHLFEKEQLNNKITVPVTSNRFGGFPQPGYRHDQFILPNPNFAVSGYLPMQNNQSSHNMENVYVQHGYNIAGSPQMLPAYRTWFPGPVPEPHVPNHRQHPLNPAESSGHDAPSDENEPSKTRLKRHPSIISQGSCVEVSPDHLQQNPLVKRRSSVVSDESFIEGLPDHLQLNPRHGRDSDLEIIGVKKKIKIKNPMRLQRPLPQPIPAVDVSPPLSSPTEAIGSWALPRYEVRVQPIEKKDDIPSAKVSIPGLVREDLLLSPDHTEQEVHLLLNVFIPGQQSLATPDPEPATAVLNFHTITVLIIEAFVQFEIGDEFGMGRGHWHTDHNQDEADYERRRDAKDVNVDEIFFAVIDRWRAGLESNKKPLQLIRGAQEFCDIALDVIYYIKEHGLLRPAPKPRKERADKGATRGGRKGEEEGEEESKKGKGKRKAEAVGKMVKTLQGRKKAKIEPKSKSNSKKKVIPEVTVTRRR